MSVAVTSFDRARANLWVRGLLTVAWADGHFDEEEREIITALTHEEVSRGDGHNLIEPITPAELAAELRDDPAVAQDFLRTAVMVAIADGVYSDSEDQLLREFSAALHQTIPALDALRHTMVDRSQTDPSLDPSLETGVVNPLHAPTPHHLGDDVLHPVRDWLDGLEIHNPRVARFLCKLIPSQCPFERDVVLFGHKLVHIPPMCKINPLYEQLVGLRFRALSYLADDCHEDISKYC